MCVLVKKHNLFKKACEVNPRVKRDPYRIVFHDIPKTSKYDKSYLTMCVRIFNKLPNDIKSLNFVQFKVVLFKWLIEKEFYSVSDYLA